MSDSKVPEGMLKAAEEAGRAADGFRAHNLEVCLEAAMRWRDEHEHTEVERLRAENLRLINCHMQFLVEGGPVVMASELK